MRHLGTVTRAALPAPARTPIEWYQKAITLGAFAASALAWVEVVTGLLGLFRRP